MKSYNCPDRRVRVESRHAEVTSQSVVRSQAPGKHLRLLLDLTTLLGVEMATPRTALPDLAV